MADKHPSNLEIREFLPSDLPDMYGAFMAAFSDYLLPMQYSYHDFKIKFVQKLQPDLEFSAGAFYQSKLVGFIFSSIDEYQDRLTAYNGGTGVIPNWRGKGITRQLYQFIFEKCREKKINRCLLEVVTTNDKAIYVYEKIGFKKNRYLKCYKLVHGALPDLKNTDSFKIRQNPRPNWNQYRQFKDFQVSLLDTDIKIQRNLKNEPILEIFNGDGLAGYCSFQPHSGRISQLAIRPSKRKKGIGKALLKEIYRRSRVKYLTIINVPQEATEMHNFLTKCGFENQVDQYEMTKDI